MDGWIKTRTKSTFHLSFGMFFFVHFEHADFGPRWTQKRLGIWPPEATPGLTRCSGPTCDPFESKYPKHPQTGSKMIYIYIYIYLLQFNIS